MIHFFDRNRSDACMFLPQTQTKACVAGFETADRYQIQQQTVPEHGMLYPAFKMLPHPQESSAQVLTSCGAKAERYV